MSKLAGSQLSLIADEAEDLARPFSDWEIDCLPPVQQRSIEQIRAVMISRAKGEMPQSPTEIVPNQLGTILKSPTPTVPNQLGTIPQTPTQIVPNSNSPQPVGDYPKVPEIDRKWNKGHQYYYLRPYINGKRESFYLGNDIDRARAKAMAIARKVGEKKSKSEIVIELAKEFPKRARSYSMMVA